MISSSSSIAPSPDPMDEALYKKVLNEGSISELNKACADAERFSLDLRLRELRHRLMLIAPVPQPFDVVLANAKALMACRSPNGAQVVLSRFSPASGNQRRVWLLLMWEAANASLDHQKASLSLRRLVDGNLVDLDKEQLPVAYREGGVPFNRPGLDVLAEHETSLGRKALAVEALLAGRTSGIVGKRRLALLVNLTKSLGAHQSSPLLVKGLEQMISDQAWELAEGVLRLKLELGIDEGMDVALERKYLDLLSSGNANRELIWQSLREEINDEGKSGF